MSNVNLPQKTSRTMLEGAIKNLIELTEIPMGLDGLDLVLNAKDSIEEVLERLDAEEGELLQ